MLTDFASHFGTRRFPASKERNPWGMEDGDAAAFPFLRRHDAATSTGRKTCSHTRRRPQEIREAFAEGLFSCFQGIYSKLRYNSLYG